MNLFESPYFGERFNLNSQRQRRREAVQVVFVRFPALGFEKKLVRILVGEGTQFVFDTGTITRPYPLNCTVEERRIREPFPQNIVNSGGRMYEIAGNLVDDAFAGGQEREFCGFFIAVLGFQCGKIHAAPIYSGRSAGLHPARLETEAAQIFGKSVRYAVACPASRSAGPSGMHQPVQESTVGEDDCAGFEKDAHNGMHSCNNVLIF